MKKLTFGLLALVVTIIVAIVSIPFFIDVDRFRPELVDLVNSKINGHFELGKLKLSLWGELAVEADEASLSDLNKNKILSVGKCKLRVPFRSLAVLKPEIRVVMNRPAVHIKKDAQELWNVMGLIKNEKPGSGETSKSSTEKSSAGGSLPAWVNGAAISVLIDEASLELEDVKAQAHYELDHLNLETGPLTMDSLPVFKLTGSLDTTAGGHEGPSGVFELTGKEKASALVLLANFDKVYLPLGAFQKKAGTPARFHAIIKKVDSKYWTEGSVEPIRLSSDYLKQDLEVSGEWNASSDAIEKAVLKLKAKAFDCEIATKLKSFESPKISVGISSNEMDLDELFDWDKMKKASLEALKKSEETPVASSKQIKSPSSSLAPRNAVGEIALTAKFIKLYKVRLEPVRGSFILKDQKLSGGFDEARVLSGQMKAKAQVDLSSAVPKYAFQTQVEGLSLSEAVASQMELLKHSMTGSLSGEMTGKGEGANARLAKKNLNASGKIQVIGATLTTIDINKMVSDGINGVISKVAERVPTLRGKELKTGNVASEFKRVTSNFTIQNGEFVAPDFFAEAIPQRGVDIKGNTKVGLLDYALKADWEVFDTYNLFHVDPILIERGKAFRVPISVGGTLLSPKYDYGQIPETLVQIALKNVGLTAQDKVKDEIKKQAEGQIKNILKGIFK